MRPHVALDEERGALGIDAAGEQHRRQLARAAHQRFRLLRHRDRVQIDDVKQMATVVAVFAWHAATREALMPRIP
ncbi:hypothetical protein D3C83_32640 [compost metagenome]